MNANSDHRHIIVTGGTGALGRSVVQLLVDRGYRLSIPCLTEEEQNKFDVASHKKILTRSEVDLTEEPATQQFYQTAVEEQGDLWASIHLAGGFGMGAIEDTPLQDFLDQLHMNTVTCYNTCRAGIQWMRKSSFTGGRIVNVAARPALEPRTGKGMTAYTVAKSGVASLTQSLAAEVVEENILINAIAPSIIDTPANRKSMSSADFSKWPKPAQLARQISWLISTENEVTRGAIIPVYGKS